MSAQEVEVMSTYCSATFGSRESVSVGVSGKEEPDSCIWHNSSSVMMSNMVSSGDRRSVFEPGPQRQTGEKRNAASYAWGGESASGKCRSAAVQDESRDTLRAHLADSPLSSCARTGCWDMPGEQRGL